MLYTYIHRDERKDENFKPLRRQKALISACHFKQQLVDNNEKHCSKFLTDKMAE